MTKIEREWPIDAQDAFLLLVAQWDEASDEDRQSTMDRTDLEMTLEKLKAMGLVEGQGEMDLQVYGMLYGYAYAKGFRPNMSEGNIHKMLSESLVKPGATNDAT
jgi:hypothetical protein